MLTVVHQLSGSSSARVARPPARAVDAELMQQLDAIHARMADGFAPPEALTQYLAFLDAMPDGVSLSSKVTVALALIDNVLAIDELKLEQRKLYRGLDAVENTTYELLVRIGRRHADIMTAVSA
jgi:hypothetical protein